MTVASPPETGNPLPGLTPEQRHELVRRAIDPDHPALSGLYLAEGCNIRFPSLGGGAGGIVWACQNCRDHGRPKYAGAPGHTPQPTVLHDAGPGSPVMYVEGVLKSFAALLAVVDGSLPYTVVFINGSDGINRRTVDTLSSQAPGRDCVVVFDADMVTNPNVARSAGRVDGHLRRAGAETVRFPRVPQLDGDGHTGLDDHLAQFPARQRPLELTSLVAGAPPDLLDRGSLASVVEGMGPTERSDHARRTAVRVCSVGLDEPAVQEWRALLKSVCGLPYSEFDAVRKDAQTQAREAVRAEANEKITRLGDQMPSPNEPLEVAHALIEQHPHLQDRVRVWRGDLYGWNDTHWAVTPSTSLTDFLRRELRHSWYMTGGKEPGPAPWAPTSGKIAEVVDALASILRRPDGEEEDRGVFTFSGRVAMDGTVAPLHPSVFNLSCLPYAYDPVAVCPAWGEFLRTSLPATEDQELLQEMFGYLLSGDTSQQKIFFLSGPPGAGKGTAMRVLQGLLGNESFTSTSLSKIGSHFGLASLVGKSVAFMPDVRFHVCGASDAIEPLLSISGEDVVPAPRKNREDWVGQLPARIVMASNDLPALPDTTAALYRRLVVVQFGQSFVGREDYGLTPRLLTELPGILNWALAGYQRLVERGRFRATAGGEALAQEARRESSPVISFLEDMCEVAEGARVTSSDLFTAWNAYRQDQGFTRKDLSKPGLTRAVCGTWPGIEPKVAKVAGKSQRCLVGLRLRAPETQAGDGSNPFTTPG